MGIRSYDAGMFTADTESTRTLTVVLPEADWRALRTVEPNAVGWLHDMIKARLTDPAPVTTAAGTAQPDLWSGDDY